MKTKIVKVDEVKIESLIKKNFSEDFMRSIYEVYSNDYISIVEKTILFDKLFTDEFGGRKDYRRIGEGTNRFVCLLDNHIIKVAYNYLAYIDNMNELAQAKYKSKYLAQAYETNGIILVSEYVTVMDTEDFLDSQIYIKRILDALAIEPNMDKEKGKFFILGDMGMSNKNYGNWGRRMNGDIVVLDYGYLYELSYNAWKEVAKCPACGSSLEYTDDYSELYCSKTECGMKVKYTTLRNSFGYGEIIKNINENLHKDKYVKFNEQGNIVVDVMDKIEIEEEPKEEFKMPEEIENRINKAKDTFFLITEEIKDNYSINIDKYYELKELIISEKDEYDELLYPFVLASLEMNMYNVNKYIRDFNKFSKARYESIFKELKGEFDKSQEVEEELEDLPDCYDEFGEYTVKGYESELKIIDRESRNGDNEVVQTSLDDMFSAQFFDNFENFFNAEDLNDVEVNDNEYSLDHILNLIEANDKLMAEEKIEQRKEQEEKEKADEDYKIYMAEKELEKAYESLEDALTEFISSRYKDAGCLVDEEEYTTGDVYRTYLNGDYIDLDYSPRVNAKNMLGGWKPNDFAFPLYRHLLIKFDYDMDQIESEFQAIYRIDEEIDVPEDLYGKIENRNYVVNQILNRFEDSMKPARHSVILNLGNELNEYYLALDKYYELFKSDVSDEEITSPDYYLSIAKNSEQLTKLINEAKSELKDELADQGYKLEDLMNKYKVVYYYDIESLMTTTELNILHLIQNSDLTGVVDVKEFILNEYYKIYNAILPDSVFDIFRYNGSFRKNEGCESHPRNVSPRLKAKLIDRNSKLDSFKPELFNKRQYKLISIEQRYDFITDMDSPEEITVMNDVKLALNKRNLFYTEKFIDKYLIKKSNDNLRFGLTEKEISLVKEFEEMLSVEVIQDVDNLVKKTIVKLLDEKYNMCEDTKEFMNDLAESNLSDAFANRMMKINILELNGVTTRLDYLTHVE